VSVDLDTATRVLAELEAGRMPPVAELEDAALYVIRYLGCRCPDISIALYDDPPGWSDSGHLSRCLRWQARHAANN
jgi:hypothetical protein